jgi:hypothetical protein
MTGFANKGHVAFNSFAITGLQRIRDMWMTSRAFLILVGPKIPGVVPRDDASSSPATPSSRPFFGGRRKLRSGDGGGGLR